MSIILWMFLFVAYSGVFAYKRATIPVYTLGLLAFAVVFSAFAAPSPFLKTIFWLGALLVTVLLNIPQLRKQFFSKPVLSFYKKMLPQMSQTEKEALEAGDVTWEAELFCGNPDWQKFKTMPKFKLSEEEQTFLDGPVQTFCNMLDDWAITHDRYDMSKEQWQYMKDNGFFALIIPKEYGGKEFSAAAHSEIIAKIAGVSVTAASTVSVPNSLGPAELIMHYGTDEQKSHYLPRLAKGEEIPCFALTGPDAGSDAASIPDTGVVTYGTFEGKKTLGVKLNFNKRYITLAPVATVVGLAFKLFDPEKLLSEEVERGITCALVPRGTKGMTIGRRHLPLNIVFQNGPIQGKDVFIPLSWIIGGEKMIGRGWQMLVECLSVGRAISLPSTCSGGSKFAAIATGAYARIRKQFNTSIGNFEGIEEAMGRIGANAYMNEAARKMTASFVDEGIKPSVASAIAKYHITESSRKVGIDAMDIHGGKGICLGPNNYLGRGYQGAPIGITVEGANILTRSLILFGQGSIRCHPYLLQEMHAANMHDPQDSLTAFDKALFGHIGFALSNTFRTFWLGLTNARWVKVDAPKETKRYYQLLSRYSAILAFCSDISMLLLGGALKRKEKLSARLGDMLSYLYLSSTVLKRYEDEGRHQDDLPLVYFALKSNLGKFQIALVELTANFPNPWVGKLLRLVCLPLGIKECGPSDELSHKIAQILMTPCPSRERLGENLAMYNMPVTDAQKQLEIALVKVIAAEPLEKRISDAIKAGKLTAMSYAEKLQEALAKELIDKDELSILEQAIKARSAVIAVDDFSLEDLVGSKKYHDVHDVLQPVKKGKKPLNEDVA